MAICICALVHMYKCLRTSRRTCKSIDRKAIPCVGLGSVHVHAYVHVYIYLYPYSYVCVCVNLYVYVCAIWCKNAWHMIDGVRHIIYDMWYVGCEMWYMIYHALYVKYASQWTVLGPRLNGANMAESRRRKNGHGLDRFIHFSEAPCRFLLRLHHCALFCQQRSQFYQIAFSNAPCL